MKVPFVDLQAQYQSIKAEIDTAISNVIEQGAFIKGPFVEDFENRFGEYIGGYCIGCGNGTDAIELSLLALGIGPGDEVLVPANSFIATSEAVSAVGATPVFVDINPHYYTIDPELIEPKITPATRAIIPVHLYGMPCDMDPIMNIAKAYQLFVIEDSAQAHGALYKGRKVGSFGDAATFSFFPGKNLGAYGDAGAVITQKADLAKRVRMYANHGRIDKYDHQFEGRNSRLDGLQAAILSVKLQYLERWSALRRKHATTYSDLLQDTDLNLPIVPDYAVPVFHLYVVRHHQRKDIERKLASHDIASGVHYPVALPLLNAYAHLGHTPEDFPISSNYQSKILSLPIYPELSKAQQTHVITILKEATAEISASIESSAKPPLTYGSPVDTLSLNQKL